MALAFNLKKANIQWDIDAIEVDVPSVRHVGVIHRGRRIRVRLTDLNDQNSDRQSLVYLSKSDDEALNVESLLALALKENMPDHPVFLAWRKQHGHEPVNITQEDLTIANLGAGLHTALRKATDSQQSIIQWNAINHLLDEDWHHLLMIICEEITKKIERVNTGKTSRLTRYQVGMAIKKACCTRFEDVSHRYDTQLDCFVERTDLQKFALQSFEVSCKITEDQDFVWAWTAYICREATESISTTNAIAT